MDKTVYHTSLKLSLKLIYRWLNHTHVDARAPLHSNVNIEVIEFHKIIVDVPLNSSDSYL